MPAEQTLDLLIGNASTPVACPKSRVVFRQGDVADAIFYIEEGKVSLTVISKTGKEAIPGNWVQATSLVRERSRARLFA